VTPYQIHNTDALSALAEIPDRSVHFVVTDPPYFIDGMGGNWDIEKLGKRTARAGVVGAMPTGMKFDPEQGRKLQAFLEPIAAECLRVLAPGGFFVSFSQARLVHRMGVAIEDAGFEIRDLFAWAHRGQPKAQKQEHHVRRKIAKGQLTADEGEAIIRALEGRKTPQLGPGFEPMVFAMKPIETTFVDNWLAHETGLVDTTQTLDGLFPTTLMPMPRPARAEKGQDNTHLTVKPVALVEHLIRLFTKPGQTVLDPFMGSGSHGVAALSAGRGFIGVEPVSEYFDISGRRLESSITPPLQAAE
jgi:site-specific DNA-methyltransferase (adenine-specific)